MSKISSNAEISSIRLKEQVAKPSAPSAGYDALYAKSGGIYRETSDGTETLLGDVAGPSSVTDGDHVVFDGATGKKIKAGTLPAASDSASGIVELATAAETTTGTATDRAVTPDGLAGSDYGKRVVQFQMNDSTALTTNAKAYMRVPAVMNGWNLVGIAGMCVGASSSGAVTFTVKKGATSMLSTNLTIDASETDSSTAATAAVIDTAQDDVATGNQIEVACSGAGTGVTYAVVELTFQAP